MTTERKLSPFDYVKAIGDPKKPWLSPTMEGYNPYMVNRALSYHAASLLAANKMNTRHGLSAEMQYAFLLGAVKPGRRWAKWVSPVKDERVATVAEVYQTNYQRARQILSLLTEEQFLKIADLNGGLEDGGTKPKKPRRSKPDGNRAVSSRARNAKANRNSGKQ